MNDFENPNQIPDKTNHIRKMIYNLQKTLKK